ncbi:phosphodiester glycosidase family protein [Nocardioides sp.]|uniref:phosphodiester glycosidase family protein n=1 Tax=Nocardioides sp. TaxID=35761 RepID=UPI0027243073|nr:phosphodiester glycosidase family protein [Nocardioides sp.]MDO9456570.1 phosphodiester glycosidase family protein [Nocardioides sp.]
MRSFPSVVLVCALTLAVPSASADRSRPHDGPRDAGRPDGYVQGTNRPQTSDGVVGPAARDVPLLLRSVRETRSLRTWKVVPGVAVTTWDERTLRGPIRATLMTVKWRTRGLTVDYANPGSVGRTAPVSSILARDRAVAGVNGDFFDIGDTGAPLGLGRDRQLGLLHGRLEGWNAAFSFGRRGWPDIGPLATHARIREHPDITITSVNSAEVEPDGVGVYTPAWGDASGYRWTGGQRREVRIVQVIDGRVAFVGTRLPAGRPYRDTLLVGRGDGARQLAALGRGSRATVTSYVDGQPRMAITGNKFLVRDGLVTVVDDLEMHPRTAIGIDRDTRTLLLLTIDGRQSFSRGYTMVELAEKMIDLGADESLNLDGGGSTTMVARRAGRLQVVNSPSDGFQRSVANAISIRYRKPRR